MSKAILRGKEAEGTKSFHLATFPEVAVAAEERKKRIEVEFKPDQPQKKEKEFVLGGFAFEYGGGYRSDEIMKKTLDEADALIADAKKRVTAIEKEAFEKGLAEGHERGKNEGAAEVSSLINALKEATAKLTGVRNEFYSNSEKEMIDLIILISSEIVAKEIKEDKNIIADTIRRAVSELHSTQSVTIRLNKADMELALSIRQGLLDEMENLENVEFAEDNSITPGGCMVKTEIGMIDATVEGRLSNLHRTLKERLE